MDAGERLSLRYDISARVTRGLQRRIQPKRGKASELLNRVRLLTSDAVLAEAECVVRRMTEQ